MEQKNVVDRKEADPTENNYWIYSVEPDLTLMAIERTNNILKTWKQFGLDGWPRIPTRLVLVIKLSCLTLATGRYM